MAGFKFGTSVTTAEPTVSVDPGLAPGVYLFALVVVDSSGNASKQANVRVQVQPPRVVVPPVIVTPLPPFIPITPVAPIGPITPVPPILGLAPGPATPLGKSATPSVRRKSSQTPVSKAKSRNKP